MKKQFVLILVVILVLSSIPLYASTGTGGMQITDNIANDSGLDIAIDKDDNMHIVYQRESNIFYKKKTNDSWSDEEKIGKGEGCSIGVDNEGVVHLAYVVDNKVNYTYKLVQGWKPPQIISETSNNYTDLDVDKNGKVHIIYFWKSPKRTFEDIVCINNVSGIFKNPTTIFYSYYANNGTTEYTEKFYTPVIKVDNDGKYHAAAAYTCTASNKQYFCIRHFIVYNYNQDQFYWGDSGEFKSVGINRNCMAIDEYDNTHLTYTGDQNQYYVKLGKKIPEQWNSLAVNLGKGSDGSIAIEGERVGVSFYSGTDVVYRENVGNGFGELQIIDKGSQSVLVMNDRKHIFYIKNDGSDDEVYYYVW